MSEVSLSIPEGCEGCPLQEWACSEFVVAGQAAAEARTARAALVTEWNTAAAEAARTAENITEAARTGERSEDDIIDIAEVAREEFEQTRRWLEVKRSRAERDAAAFSSEIEDNTAKQDQLTAISTGAAATCKGPGQKVRVLGLLGLGPKLSAQYCSAELPADLNQQYGRPSV